MLRLLLTTLVAVALHVGVGAVAVKTAKRMERPLQLRTKLVDKRLLEEIRERIEEMKKEDEEIEIDFSEIDEAIAKLETDELPAMAMLTDWAEPAPPAPEKMEASLDAGAEAGLEAELEAEPEPLPEPPPPLAMAVDAVAVDTLTAADPAEWAIVDNDEESKGPASVLAQLDAIEGGVADMTGAPAGVLTDGAVAYRVRGGVVGGVMAKTGKARRSRGLTAEASEPPVAVKTKERRRSVRVARVTAKGLDDGDAKRRLRKKRKGFQKCYRRALKHDPELGGRIELRFSVNRSGFPQVSRSREVVLRELADEGLTRCILGQIAGMRFGKPAAGDAEIRLTLELTP